MELHSYPHGIKTAFRFRLKEKRKPGKARDGGIRGTGIVTRTKGPRKKERRTFIKKGTGGTAKVAKRRSGSKQQTYGEIPKMITSGRTSLRRRIMGPPGVS